MKGLADWREGLRERYAQFERQKGTPEILEDYLVEARRLPKEANRAKEQFCDALLESPDTYCHQLRSVPYRFLEPLRDVPLLARRSSKRPTTIDAAVYFERRFHVRREPRLYLFSVRPGMSRYAVQEEEGLLKWAGLFFFTNYAVQSRLWVLEGCPGAYRATSVPFEYRTAFKGLFQEGC